MRSAFGRGVARFLAGRNINPRFSARSYLGSYSTWARNQTLFSSSPNSTHPNISLLSPFNSHPWTARFGGGCDLFHGFFLFFLFMVCLDVLPMSICSIVRLDCLLRKKGRLGELGYLFFLAILMSQIILTAGNWNDSFCDRILRSFVIWGTSKLPITCRKKELSFNNSFI